jgi:hypothetical protein
MTMQRTFNFTYSAMVFMALLLSEIGLIAENAGAADPGSTTFTSLRQLREALGQERRKVCSFQLDGIVRAADASNDVLFLQDDSEAAMIELGLGRRGVATGTACPAVGDELRGGPGGRRLADRPDAGGG